MEPTTETITMFVETFGTWGTIILVILFLIFYFGKEYVRNKKEKFSIDDRQVMLAHIKNNSVTMSNIEAYLKVATKQYSEELTRVQAIIILEKFYALSEKKLILFGLEVINNNNIDTRQAEIRSKVELFTKNLYSEQGNSLNEYKFKKKRLEKVMDYEQSHEVFNEVLDIILKNKGGRVLVSYIENTFKGFINSAKNQINEY